MERSVSWQDTELLGLSGTWQYHDIRYSSLDWEDGSDALTWCCELEANLSRVPYCTAAPSRASLVKSTTEFSPFTLF